MGGERRRTADFCNKKLPGVEILSNRTDSRASPNRPDSGHRVPLASMTLQRSRRAELESMLPGFRFLFTAIILSMSILIFGLGAAALLRAAHEEFANLPSRRATPEPMFARRYDDPPPTLALLRIDPPVAEKPAENVPAAAVPEAAPDIPAPAGQAPDAPPAEPEKLAALKLGRAGRSRGEPEAERGDTGRSGLCGRNRGARCQCGSEARRHRGNAGTCRLHPPRLRRSRQRISLHSKATSPRPGSRRSAVPPSSSTKRRRPTRRKPRPRKRSRTQRRQKTGRGAGPGTAADCARGGRVWHARRRWLSSNCRPTRSRNCRSRAA